MTEQEAIKEIERHIQFLRENWKPHPDYNVIEALREGLIAIEKIQEYRAIGTVEELKFIKQWKADVVEGFCKYDASSLEELVGNARSKAIDEFAEKLKVELDKKYSFGIENKFKLFNSIDEIAEQMKGGAE